jgi:hypothetical protein
MYRAKLEGRGRWCFYSADMVNRSARQLQLEAALRRAEERNELALVYQPQLCLQSGRLVGMEALIRWKHPELGMISPAEFIPLAESSGQILSIGAWVMRTAVRQMKQWIDEGQPSNVVAVNLSAVQFRDPACPNWFRRCSTTPACPQLPGTGTDRKRGRPQPGRGLRDHGPAACPGRAPVDRRLRHRLLLAEPPQALPDPHPEDRPVLRARHRHRSGRPRHRAGHHPDGPRAAPDHHRRGVETDEQAAFLQSHGCEAAQGYRFCKPLPPEDAQAWVQNHTRRTAPAGTDHPGPVQA